VTEDLSLSAFVERCVPYFDDDGKLVDQPFIPAVVDGMTRAYLVRDEVVGFARQQPAGGAVNVLGLPSHKTMHDADAPTFNSLRTRLEREWIPGLCALSDLAHEDLPLLWDADFLAGDDDAHVLCEINVSSVLPFPPQAPRALARAVRQRLDGDG
jgi:hypothetical protein